MFSAQTIHTKKWSFPWEKLILKIFEGRLVVGHCVDTRHMVVHLSERRREKILSYIVEEGWLHPGRKATMKEVAQLLGMFGSAAEYLLCPTWRWGNGDGDG